MNLTVALIALILIIVLDVIATALLIRSDFETPLERTLQLLMIWLIPFAGSIAVISLQTSSGWTPQVKIDPGPDGTSLPPGIDGNLIQLSDHSHAWGDSSYGGDAGHGGH